MLTQIDVDSENAFFVPILGVTPKASLLVRQITGLNPPGVNLFIGEYAQDGGTYQGRRVDKRNVVITFDLNPNPAAGETIQGLRELLYKAFLDPQVDADYIKLNLHLDDGRVLYVVGYTEKFETEIFSIETLAQISFICPDPYIRDVEAIELTNNTGWSTVPFAYEGTAESGFEVEIYPTTGSTKLTLSNNGKVMEFDGSYSNTQVIYINTNPGRERSVKKALKTDLDAWYAANPTDTPAQAWAGLTDLNQVTSMIGQMHTDSPWLQIHAQSNEMKTYSTVAGDGKFAIRKLRYIPAYWGI